MKLSAKPISSPGRAEKYPPPLMRFLRSNVGSRSRGRSRSSPMFVRKKNTAIETQEPSSPKVTCMGQVRVRRSKQTGSKPGAPTKRQRQRRHRRCKWIKNAMFCYHFTWKHKKPKSFRPSWGKWVSLFHIGFRRKTKTRQDSSKFGNRSQDFEQENVHDDQDDEEEEEEEEEEEAAVFVSTSSPPKNALLLMRCRSAPYRSSSLASRFWGSPLANQETEEEQEENKEEENPTSGRESICKDSDQESRMDSESEEKLGFFKEFDDSDSIKEKFVKSANTIVSIQELKAEDLEGVTVRPLILTRCKSEPARTGEKLDPDLSFWNKRRLGFS